VRTMWPWHRNRVGGGAVRIWQGGEEMNRIGIVLIVVLGMGAAGLVALSSWTIPAPTVAVNKVVPDADLPQ